MPTGPGKYDDEATWVRKATKATGVVVIVVHGTRGSGFSVQMPRPALDALPDVLEKLARDIRKDLANG